MSSAQQLNYAPRPPAHKRWNRWLVIAAILIALAASSSWLVPLEWRRMQLLYWQNRCLAYTAPANHRVFDPNSSGPYQSPPEWTKFYAIYSPPGLRSAGTIFLHELKKPDGERRLVALDLESESAGLLSVVYPRVFIPGTLLRSPAEAKAASNRCLIEMPSATLFSAVPDPADPTHFTFKAQLNSLQITYDGWLGNDDRVVIGPRKITSAPN